MPQEAASSGLVDPDSRPPPPPPSSPPPAQQLSPEALRELVLACGSEAEGGNEASSPTRDRLRGQLGFCFDPMPWDLAAAAVADGGVAAMGRMGRTPEGVARYWRWRDEVCAGEYASTADYVRIEIMGCEAAVAGGESRGEVVGGGGGWGWRFFSFRFRGGSSSALSFSRTLLLPPGSLFLSLDNRKKTKRKTGERSRGLPPQTRPRGSSGGKTCAFFILSFSFFFFPLVRFLVFLLSLLPSPPFLGPLSRSPSSPPPAPGFPPPPSLSLSRQDFPYNFEAGVEHLNVWAFSALAPARLELLVEARRPRADFETLWYVNPAALASIPDVWHAHVLSRRRRRKE